MKTAKLFAVIWRNEVNEFYGVKDDDIVFVEPKEEIRVNVSKNRIGRPKWQYSEPLAIFLSLKEAEAYRAGNTDWASVPCSISYKEA